MSGFSMHRFAQTNIQLLNQLRLLGYLPGGLSPVVGAYELAMRLFTGRFRASGKTFMSHVVGTASILASLRASPSLVASGLIHAAYGAGDFGDGDTGMTEARRGQVKSVVGEEVEEYVARYTRLRWYDEAIATIHAGLKAIESRDRDVLLMRLANELEEYLDLGILYSGGEKRQQVNYINENGELMIQMAEELGFPTLASDFAQAFKEAASTEIPPGLRRRQNSSFLLAPQTHQRLTEAVARRLAERETSGPGKERRLEQVRGRVNE